MIGFDTLLGTTVSVLALSLSAPVLPETPSSATPTISAEIVQSGAEIQTHQAAAEPAPLILASVQETAAPEVVVEEQPLFSEESFAEDMIATAVPVVFADLTDQQVFDRAVAYIEGLDTYTANFIQTAPSGRVSTGTLKMSRPGRLRVDYEAPSAQLIVATQGKVYINDRDLETTDSYPLKKTPLRFLLDQKIKTDDVVLTDVTRTEDSVSIGIKSSDAETEGELILVFEAPNLLLRRWAVVEPSNAVTILDLDGIEIGKPIAANEFRIPEAGGTFTRDR